MSDPRPLVMIILDGWGIAPDSPGNAVTRAKTPTLDSWRSKYPSTQLKASGQAVGLSPRQDGNSEAGHMNLGAGRVVKQDAERISATIADGRFFRNPAFHAAIRHVNKYNSALHIMGMLGSKQSAHADPDHLMALLMLAQQARLQHVWVHLFTDGRDSPRYFAREMLERMLPHFGDARVGTVMGRFYGMDRNKNWERTELAYNALRHGQADYHVDDPLDAITQAYNRGESDEFIKPTIVNGFHGMQENDSIIFFNLRSDRARQIAKTFVQTDFERQNAVTGGFTRRDPIHPLFVSMTDIGPDLGDMLSAYPAVELTETLPMVLKNFRQLYIAESEKYAHVTYFFNGGYAQPVAGEQRRMVPSASVPNFANTPGMQSPKIGEIIRHGIHGHQYDVIVANFANTDMVGHTGNLAAGIAAMEITDKILRAVGREVLAANGTLIVTADHGNLEEMLNLQTQAVDTEHSNNPVPFLLIDQQYLGKKLRTGGELADVAPTILEILQVKQPDAMTGRSLLQA